MLRNSQKITFHSRYDGSFVHFVSHLWCFQEIRLCAPHFDLAKLLLAHHGVDVSFLENERKIILKRSLTLSTKRVNKNGVKSTKPHLKFLCEINGQKVTMKILRAIGTPFITLVDASTAASALAKPNARVAILDKGVPSRVKAAVTESRSIYRRARQLREDMENKIESKLLPATISIHDNVVTDEALDILRHWVDELDEFERRIQHFQELCSGSESNGVAQLFTSSSWSDSSFFSNLLDFRDDIKCLDDKIVAAESAIDALSSLSSSKSVVSALERARLFLFDATKQKSERGSSLKENQSMLNAAEIAHQSLNNVESALASCVRSVEESNNGLLAKLQKMRSRVRISVEEIDAIIADWNSFARKHNVSPFDLPCCHQSMRSELSGGDESREKLRRAVANEEIALKHFERSCAELTDAREKVADMLSESVMQCLPSLEMEQSVFHVQLDQSTRLQCTSPSAFGIGSGLGLDTVNFFLQHKTMDPASGQSGEEASFVTRGGMLEDVGSAGEKARILLAIETVLGGAVKASCSGGATEAVLGIEAVSGLEDAIDDCPPVAVFYDEIDAHCGGRASVAVAKLLASQTRQPINASRRRGQIVSITHSPSVAAIADRHIVIQTKTAQTSVKGKPPVFVSKVDGVARRKELARMAAGNMAPEEAEIFADALLREGTLQRDGGFHV